MLGTETRQITRLLKHSSKENHQIVAFCVNSTFVSLPARVHGKRTRSRGNLESSIWELADSQDLHRDGIGNLLVTSKLTSLQSWQLSDMLLMMSGSNRSSNMDHAIMRLLPSLHGNTCACETAPITTGLEPGCLTRVSRLESTVHLLNEWKAQDE